MGWDVNEGMSVWSGQSGREFEKLREFDKAFDEHDKRFAFRFTTIIVIFKAIAFIVFLIGTLIIILIIINFNKFICSFNMFEETCLQGFREER